MFQLTETESKNLWFQIETKNLTFETHGGKFNKPYAFTEEVLEMIEIILHTPVAELKNIKIMDTFFAKRKYIGSNLITQNNISNMVLKHDNEILKNANDIKEFQNAFKQFEDKRIVNEIYDF